MDARPVLGLQSVRPPFLDDVSAAGAAQAETRNGARIVTHRCFLVRSAIDRVTDDGDLLRARLLAETLAYSLQDDDGEDEEDEDDDDDDDVVSSDDDDDDDEDDEDEDEEEEETWQV
jgi:hypothetical protein